MEEYYKQIRNEFEDFVLPNIEVKSVERNLKNLDVGKVSGIEISAKSLKGGAQVTAIYLTNIITLSIKFGSFLSKHMVAKRKPLFHKEVNIES